MLLYEVMFIIELLFLFFEFEFLLGFTWMFWDDEFLNFFRFVLGFIWIFWGDDLLIFMYFFDCRLFLFIVMYDFLFCGFGEIVCKDGNFFLLFKFNILVFFIWYDFNSGVKWFGI